ncbi:hypothetical protein CS0771_40610 [Catellatospora sp. IY07-71]|uniref:hypothetical protein n=1 Tax=Catellatospora sp. IY07-71 TaxID=2728827 RepID=UPI001BB40B2F|nr:hypothetical protein [Catellatospora sp. IY07-71]BCJ74517.1 hypothetical protein CS0771_40610 [Catellatospora sp. IY07-71]
MTGQQWTNDRAAWLRHFSDALVSGDGAEIEAAVAAAAAAATGADQAGARAAGYAAAKRHRDARGSGSRAASAAGAGTSAASSGPPRTSPGTARTTTGSAGGAGTTTAYRPAGAPADAPYWSQELAQRLMTIPARWGWQAAEVAVAAEPELPEPGERPLWQEPPRPDSSALRAARAKARSKLVLRLCALAFLAVAYTAYQEPIQDTLDDLGDDGRKVALAVAVLAGVMILAGLSNAIGGLRYATRAIADFEQPYLAYRKSELDRHRQAERGWNDAVRRLREAEAQAAREATRRAAGPLWYPVHPLSEPTRIDVFGGDPHRNGWASLLTTLGASLVAKDQRLTVLDLTGQDVGGNLAQVTRSAGRGARLTDLRADGVPGLDLLHGLRSAEVAQTLADALRNQEQGDHRQEWAFTVDALGRAAAALGARLTFARLAAAVQVLRQNPAPDLLTADEVGVLVGQVGELDRGDWSARQLMLLQSQLAMLDRLAPATGGGGTLWSSDQVTIVSTAGGHDERKHLVDRLLVQLAERAMADGRLTGFLIVAGADHLGAAALQRLSSQARSAGVRLLLMIDQPQGDLERTAGTGGVVCLMKMYNHRDAAVAAEFIGREHRFVLHAVTRQVGRSFSDGGGDSFAANTGHSDNTSRRSGGRPGKDTGLSDSRGHVWTGTRNWSAGESISTSTSSQRVYEFTVDPQEVLNLPETAFFLVDNSGHGRQVVLADSNPGICLLDRVSLAPKAR